MKIQTSWLLQKSTDPDLHCLHRQGISRLGRTRVNVYYFWFCVYVCMWPCLSLRKSCKTKKKKKSKNKNLQAVNQVLIKKTIGFFLPKIWVLSSFWDKIQSTLIILRSKRPSEILWDIRTLTYPICKTEDKINQTTTFNSWICNFTPEFKDIWKILSKRGETG